MQPPFDERHEALPGLRHTLPDHPTIPLSDGAAVAASLARELGTERLGRLYWMLFLVSNRENISPLHHQLIKRRQIVLTERPDLHLVWNYDRIFIKPLPRCLLSYSFWRAHLHPGSAAASDTMRAAGLVADESWRTQNLWLEAQGFVRTYARLITHESDFALAQKLGLLPPPPPQVRGESADGVVIGLDWPTWSRFIQGFALLRDAEVSPRYHYGEVRLARLNFWSRVLLRGSYLEVHHTYGSFFARFGAPYLLVYGAVAVILAALQTAVQVDSQGAYRDFALGFVPFSIGLTAAGLASFPVLYAAFLMKELLLFVFRHRPLSR